MISTVRNWWYRGKRDRRKLDTGPVGFHSTITSTEYDYKGHWIYMYGEISFPIERRNP